MIVTVTDNREIPADRITLVSAGEIMAQYADEIAAAGFTYEQIAAAASAIKSGGELPQEFMDAISGMSATDSDTKSRVVNTEISQK